MSLIAPRIRRHGVALVVLASLILPVSACTDDDPSPTAEPETERPVQTVAEARTDEETRDELAGAGIDPADLDCAQARTDSTIAIDEAELAELRERCEGAKAFAGALADNIGTVTDEQRACLTKELIALPPDTVAGFYTDALRPDTVDTSKPDELAIVLDTCGVESRPG